MKKFIFFITFISFSVLALSQENNFRTRADESINPELENLSGLYPDVNDFNPANSATSGFGSSEIISNTNSSQTTIASEESKDDSDGSRSIKNTAIDIYPNPASEYLVIKLDGDVIGKIRLLNLLGQELQSVVITGSNTLDISEYEQGIYFISIESAGEKVVRKVKFVN